MNTRQENKLSMYLAVRKCLNDFNAVWAALAGISSVVTLFLSKITTIQNTENRQQKSSKGATTTKKDKKANLIELMLIVIGAIKSYAKDVNDENLFNSVNFTQTELEKIGDSILIDRANLILGIANANAANILNKGITALMLGDLLTLTTEYDDAASGPRTVISDKKTATEQLGVLFSDTDKLLKENLDNLILQFKNTNNDFFLNYFNNREIIDLGTQHTRLGGTVTDTEGNPLEGALVVAEEADLEEETNVEGVYLFKPFIPGDISIRVEKVGFVTKTITNVHVSPGQHLVLDVELEREVVIVTINGMQIANIFGPSNPKWMVGATVKIKNITSGPSIGGGHFYPADTSVEGWNGTGTPILPGQEVVHTVTAGEFKAYVNGYVQGPNAQTFELMFL